MFTIIHNITDSEVEPVYKHVHHATSIILCERARLRFIEALGHSNDSLIKRGIFIVIVGLEARYEREIFKEQVTVTCENWQLRRKSLIIDQRIVNSEGKTAVELKVHLLFMSGDSRSAIVPPPDFVEALESFSV